jgi:Cof subfamily protein (haloacid dehalogenase superfamily)
MTPSGRSPVSKISALISDVDGTLLTEEKVLTDRTRRAVVGLRARGIAFSIISSRPPRGLRMLLDPLQITTPVAGFNGGAFATAGLSVISQHLLSPVIARRAVDFMTASGAQVWLFSGQDWLVRDADGPRVGLEERTVQFPPTAVEAFGRALDFANKIVGVSDDFALLARCDGEMRLTLAGGASVVRSQRYYLDITHPLANKGTGVLALAKLLAIPMAEIAVIGDGGNDVAMFEQSGLSIAMGNASPDVQKQARFVTASCNDEGFAEAVERHVLGARAETPVEPNVSTAQTR